MAAVAAEPLVSSIHRRRQSHFGHDRDVRMTSPRTIKGAKSILRFWAPVVLSLLCSSTTFLAAEASEARYRVIKIIEGNGTTIPEAGESIRKAKWSDRSMLKATQTSGSGATEFGRTSRWATAAAAWRFRSTTGQWSEFLHGRVYRRWFWKPSPVYHAFVWTKGPCRPRHPRGWNSGGLWINDQGVCGASSSDNHDGLPFITGRADALAAEPDFKPFRLETRLGNSLCRRRRRIWGLGTYGGKEHIYEMTPEGNGMYRIKSRTVLDGLGVKVYGFNEYGQGVAESDSAGSGVLPL